jgi:hypothetical protein
MRLGLTIICDIFILSNVPKLKQSGKRLRKNNRE